MFLRNADPLGIWDTDSTARWSTVTGVKGPSVGTFEYSQFLSHFHNATTSTYSGTPGPNSFISNTTLGSAFAITTTQMIGNTGGTETRPVNMYVNYYIKY